MTGAHILMQTLKDHNVSTVFGYPGGALLSLYDVFPEFPSINHILVRHEQGAALAADGYARSSGKVGVCIATSGPGATNLVTGIANAYADSIPIVAITGQVSTPFIGSDAFQEVDITGITEPITKHNYLVENIKDLEAIIKEAFFIAQDGRPGPVLIDIPGDIFKAKAPPKSLHTKFDQKKVQKILPPLKKEQLEEAALKIAKAQKPIILAGHGVLISNASKELKELAKKGDIPVITTLLGMGCFPETHPLSFGMLGMHGMAHANFAVHNADLIIAIGMRFDDRITGKKEEFGKKSKIIHIDIDPAEIDKNKLADIPLIGDAKKTLSKLNSLVKTKKHKDWVNQINKWLNSHPISTYDQITKGHKKEGPLKANEVINIIYHQTKGNAIIVSDVGQNQMFTAHHYHFDHPKHYLNSGGLGTMGYSLPAAIGAKMANPQKEVWAIMGDGGFQMNIQELMTIVQENLNINIAIFHNSFLGMVRQWQELFYNKNYVGTPLLNPNFTLIAEAYGIEGIKAQNFEEGESAVKMARISKKSTLIEFIMQSEENVFPMVPPGTPLKNTIIRK